MNDPYSWTVPVTGGTGIYGFSLTQGALPPGLALSISGVVSGTLSANATPGMYNFTVTAADADGQSIAQSYTLVVDPVLVSQSSSPVKGILFPGTAGSPYSQAFSATGGNGGSYQWSLPPGSNDRLPLGLVLSADGVLSGTINPNVTPGIYTFSVRTTDTANGYTDTDYSMQVAPPLQIAQASLPDVAPSTLYSVTLQAMGGSDGGYQFAVSEGTLPTGLTLSSNGNLSGTVPGTTTPGKYSFKVTLTDGNGATTTVKYTLTVLLQATVDTQTTTSGQSIAVPGQAIPISASLTNLLAPVSYSFDWGDGTTTVSATPNVTHAYTTSGTFLVQLNAIDTDGTASNAAFMPVTVTQTAQQGNQVSIGGTPGNDTFALTPLSSGALQIQVNGVTKGTVKPGTPLQLYGDTGTDQLIITGTGGADHFTLNGQTIVFNGFTIQTAGFESLTINAGAGNDTLVASNTTIPVTFNGGTGSNTLTGPNQNAVWNITGANAGNVGQVSFSGVQYLQGGSGDDRFQFATAGSVTRINGGGGTNTLVESNRNHLWQITGTNSGAPSTA